MRLINQYSTVFLLFLRYDLIARVLLPTLSEFDSFLSIQNSNLNLEFSILMLAF